jgi:glycosyltransferase involved in cell wall biosynthesis
MCPGGVDTYINQLVDYGIKDEWEITLILDENSNTLLPKTIQNKCRIVFAKLYHKNYSETVINKSITECLKNLKNTNIAHVICGIPWSCILVREILLSFKFSIINTEQYVYDSMSFTDIQIKRIRDIYSRTHKIIFVEKSNLSYMQNTFKDSMNNNFCVINNSVDVNVIALNSITLKKRINTIKKKHHNKQTIYFLLVGRLAYQKGFDILIEAVSLLSIEERNMAKFDIYGNGAEYENLSNMINDKSLSNCIRIHNWIENPRSLFNNYDVFVFPSRTEGLSFTLLEAFANNIPSIVSNIPSNIALSKNGHHADIFNLTDVNSLSKVLSNWIKNSIEKIVKVHNTRDWITQNFNSNNNIKKTLNLWNEIYANKE